MPKTGLTSEEIKAKAIHFAEERIRKLGYEKTRLIDVAKDLGITHSALYIHFPDKASLLDAVTNSWLESIDSQLEKITKQQKPPTELIKIWFLTLHSLKKKKVSLDPELFKAFNSAADSNKECIQNHLKNSNKQLSYLVELSIKEGYFQKNSIQKIVDILFYSTLAYHYPKLVAQNLHLKQENQLKELLNVIFKGLQA
jgi:AcrR family transcriptional regulator